MIRQNLFIFKFDNGAAGVLHTDQALATHFLMQQYDLPQLKCILEVAITPSQDPKPTVVFIHGVITIKRRAIAPNKPTMRANPNEPDELVYEPERRSTHGPANEIQEVNDYSLPGFD
jgi:hypothetical protein